MKILVADAFPASHIAALQDLGHEVVLDPSIDADHLAARLLGVDVLVVRSTKVTAAAIGAADRLAIVVRAGAGVNTIDLEAAARAGVLVANTPGMNAIAVAELTIGLLLALDRNIPDGVADLRNGTWNKSAYLKARGIAGSTLGIVGMGAIGLEVAKRAIALQMHVLTSSSDRRSETSEAALVDLGVVVVSGMEAMLAQCDVVSVHVPVTPETIGMVDAGFLGAMKDGAWLLNTSRGEIVDEDALLSAIDQRGFRCGLDVFVDEPASGTGAFTSALARHPAVYGTHHIGASTEQAQRAIADAVFSIVEGFGRGVLPAALNLAEAAGTGSTILVRHRNEVGALVAILGVLRSRGLNIEEMANRVFVGGIAASAILNVDAAVDGEIVEALTDLGQVFGVSVTTR